MTISVEEFKKGLSAKNISDNQKKMLIFNYQAKNHNITATELSRKMKFKNYNAANLIYGKLAKIIGDTLKINKMPKELIGIFVDFDKPLKEWHWILKSELVQALEEIKWVKPNISYFPEEISKNEQYYEGASSKILVNKFERNSVARNKCLEKYGYICKICGIDLCNTYGSIAKNFIHVHHLKLLSEIKDKYEVDPINDLIPVCPNCHAIIHLSSPPYTEDEMKKIISLNSKRK